MARRASQNAQDQGLSSRLEVVVALGNWLSELVFKVIGSGSNKLRSKILWQSQAYTNSIHSNKLEITTKATMISNNNKLDSIIEPQWQLTM